MGVPGLAVTGPGILDLGGVLTEDGGRRVRGSRGRALEAGLGGLTGGLRGPLGPNPGPGLGYGGDIFVLILNCTTRLSAKNLALNYSL